MAKRSFLSDLRYIETAVQRQAVPASGVEIFKLLVGFVEACPFSKSKNYKFLCRNWRLDYGSLNRVWVSEGGKSKKQATFRVQASSLSNMLYSMFPSFSRELFVSDIYDEATEQGYQEIKATMEVIRVSSGYPDELFISEVSSCTDNLCPDGAVSAEDCLTTAAQLKPLLKSEISAYLGSVDQDQLKYILSVLQKPLFGVRSVECNTEKVALLKAIGESNAVLPCASQEKPVKVREVFVEVPEKSPYNLAIGKSLSDVITKRANERITPEETAKYLRLSEAEKAKRKRTLVKLLLLFTEEGLQKQLSHYNSLELCEVLNGDYPLTDGETAYCFKPQ